MNNTVLVESKIRQRLRLACTVMCVFCMMMIVFVFTVTMIEKKNLNGQVTEVTATLDKVYETDSNVITMQDGKEYNVVWSKDIDVDLNDYKGKEITIFISAQTFVANPWVLGLVVDGNTVVDYNETLTSKTETNSEMKTVVWIVTAIICAATCGLFVWRFNAKPHAERPLYGEFAEFLTPRQPTCPQRKVIVYYVCAYIAVVFALMVIAVCLDSDAETLDGMSAAAQAVLWTLLAVVVLGAVGLFVVAWWIVRREIDFYAENLPFDFSDISHAQLRKKVKAELQEQIRKEREQHPDTYADGGNGYDVTFAENGVVLTVPYDEEYNVELPKAEEVFAYNDTEAQPNDLTATDNVYNVSGGVHQNAITLSYDALNFEAIAYFRKRIRPMMIIVKSRLERQDDFPEEFVNDIHIALDINLLRTLQKYNVKVENLDYLLKNKKQLMMENCIKYGKTEDKMTK